MKRSVRWSAAWQHAASAAPAGREGESDTCTTVQSLRALERSGGGGHPLAPGSIAPAHPACLAPDPQAKQTKPSHARTQAFVAVIAAHDVLVFTRSWQLVGLAAAWPPLALSALVFSLHATLLRPGPGGGSRRG